MASFKATSEQIGNIINYYKDYQVDFDITRFVFKAESASFNVLIYPTNTVLFQGKDAEVELARWYKEEIEIIDHAGSDEVGCGDYFGPILVCASIVKESDYEYLKSLGVKDSKKLDDNTIRRIAPLIKKQIKTVTFALTNEKYNELVAKGYNLNKIKAYAHNFVLNKIVKGNKFKGKVVVDQFCEETLYYRYLTDYKDNEILRGIYFTPKAESKYLAVAASSIVARDAFLELIDKMSNEIGHKVILGASDEVDKLAKQILDEKGADYLYKYVKWHFKNTQKIQENTLDI